MKYISSKYKYLLFEIFILLLLSSCMQLQPTVEKLIKAPKLVGEFYEINKTLESVIGSNLILKYPKSGDYKSAFILRDIDGDGQDEAIAFYSVEDDEDKNVKISILDKINGVWTNVCSTNGLGIDIDKIFFAKLTSSNEEQIVINWLRSNNIDKSLQVYNYMNKKLRCIYDMNYMTDAYAFDIDGDLKNELVIIDRTSEITPKVKLVKSVINENEEELELVSEVRLKPGALKYNNIMVGNLEKGRKALFLDNVSEYESFNSTLYTEVIVAMPESDKNKLYIANLFYNLQLGVDSTEKTTRIQSVNCRDVDGDGLIEMPKKVSYLQQKVDYKDKVFPLTLWQHCFDNNLSFAAVSVENVDAGYSFIFPYKWIFTFAHENIQDKMNEDPLFKANPDDIYPLVSVFPDVKSDELIFKTNANIDNFLSTEVMRIKIVDNSNSLFKNNNYIKIGEKNQFSYYVCINENNKILPISISQIKKLFFIN